MTTTPLHDYLITCDRKYRGAQCHREILLQAVVGSIQAESGARAQGWVIGLRAGCPGCEKWWAEQEGDD